MSSDALALVAKKPCLPLSRVGVQAVMYVVPPPPRMLLCPYRIKLGFIYSGGGCRQRQAGLNVADNVVADDGLAAAAVHEGGEAVEVRGQLGNVAVGLVEAGTLGLPP